MAPSCESGLAIVSRAYFGFGVWSGITIVQEFAINLQSASTCNSKT